MIYKWFIILLLLLLTILIGCNGESANENTQNVPEPVESSDQSATSSVEILGDCAVLGDFPERTTCTTVSVTCANLPPMSVDLRTTSYEPATDYIGMVVLGSGGAGRAFFGTEAPTIDKPQLNIVLQLSKAGYTVVERNWHDGWFGPGSEGFGIIQPACRHAELLKWLDEEAETPGAMCAYGNSGGSAEIAYGLTRWDTETVLDAAILGGGPPTTRMELGCLGFESYPEWEQSCNENWTTSQSECSQQAPICTYDERTSATGPGIIDASFSIAGLSNLCTSNSTTFAPLFEENSILFPGADLDYPNTAVHFILGKQDCTIAATQGPLYLEAINSEKSIEFLEGVGHTVQDSETGANAIVQAVLDNCSLEN